MTDLSIGVEILRRRQATLDAEVKAIRKDKDPEGLKVSSLRNAIKSIEACIAVLTAGMEKP